MTRSMAGNRARETPWRSILPVTTSHVQVTDDNLIYILCLFTVILLYLRVVKFCDSQIIFYGKINMPGSYHDSRLQSRRHTVIYILFHNE